MIHYANLNVYIHGFEEGLAESHRHVVDCLLIDALNPDARSDLDVYLEEEAEDVKYLSVRVHGLNDPTTEIVRRKVEDAIRGHFCPLLPGQVVVTVDHFAGTPER